MSERVPLFDNPFADSGTASDVASDVASDGGPGDGAHQPLTLRETLAHWTRPVEEELSEEEQLANFLEVLGKSEHNRHQAAGADASNKVGRRAAPRLRLSLPARFVSVEETHKAILLNLSRTGAQIAILNSVREGEGGILECGKLKAFGVVARSEFSINAIAFEEPLSEEDVLDIRRYYEEFEERERRQLIETARQWVTGVSKDGRAL